MYCVYNVGFLLFSPNISSSCFILVACMFFAKCIPSFMMYVLFAVELCRRVGVQHKCRLAFVTVIVLTDVRFVGK